MAVQSLRRMLCYLEQSRRRVCPHVDTQEQPNGFGSTLAVRVLGGSSADVSEP